MENLKVIPTAQDKRFSRYHFFACKYGFISNEIVYLYFLHSKQVKINSISNINVFEKYENLIQTLQYRSFVLFIFFLNLIFFKKQNDIIFQFVLGLSLIIGILIKIKIVVFNINDNKKLEFKICKKEFRKAKLFKRKIFEYKKHLESKDFYN